MQEWKKEYLRVLEYEKGLFEKEFRIPLSRKFSPDRWVRGTINYFLKEPEVIWSNIKYCGSGCNTIDIWLRIFSEKDTNKDYAFRIKYRFYSQNGLYYPYEWEHSCDDTFSLGTSSINLCCKHLYTGLLFIDKRLRGECEKIAESTFIPNQNFLSHAREIIYSRREASEKLSLLFNLMKKELSLEEGRKLAVLNKRIEYLRKV